MRRVAVRSKHMGSPRMRISLRLAFFAASLEVGSSAQTDQACLDCRHRKLIANGILYTAK